MARENLGRIFTEGFLAGQQIRKNKLQLTVMQDALNRQRKIRGIMNNPAFISGDTAERFSILERAGEPEEALAEVKRAGELAELGDEQNFRDVLESGRQMFTDQETGVVDRGKLAVHLLENAPGLAAQQHYANFLAQSAAKLGIAKDNFQMRELSLRDAFRYIKMGDNENFIDALNIALPELGAQKGWAAKEGDKTMIHIVDREGQVQTLTKMDLMQMMEGPSNELDFMETEYFRHLDHALAKKLALFKDDVEGTSGPDLDQPRKDVQPGKKEQKKIKSAIEDGLKAAGKDFAFFGRASDEVTRDVENLVALAKSKGGTGMTPENSAFAFAQMMGEHRTNPETGDYVPLSDDERAQLTSFAARKDLRGHTMMDILRYLISRETIRSWAVAPEQHLGPSQEAGRAPQRDADVTPDEFDPFGGA